MLVLVKCSYDYELRQSQSAYSSVCILNMLSVAILLRCIMTPLYMRMYSNYCSYSSMIFPYIIRFLSGLLHTRVSCNHYNSQTNTSPIQMVSLLALK